jgi:hypothetical protein
LFELGHGNIYIDMYWPSSTTHDDTIQL